MTDPSRAILKLLADLAIGALGELTTAERGVRVTPPSWYGAVTIHESYCGHGLRAAYSTTMPDVVTAEQIFRILYPGIRINRCGHCYPT